MKYRVEERRRRCAIPENSVAGSVAKRAGLSVLASLVKSGSGKYLSKDMTLAGDLSRVMPPSLFLIA
ncbi:MAG TPA: hypothetical protein VF534_02515 [Paraburkholderia sp.]